MSLLEGFITVEINNHITGFYSPLSRPAIYQQNLTPPSTVVVDAHILNHIYICFCLTLFLKVPTMTATSSCSNLLVRNANKSTGTIYSSRSSSTYSNNMDCRWNLTSNAMIELLFYEFATESSADYVSVYDGDSTSAPLIGQFSGSSLPAPITSSSTKLYVRFTSDSSVLYRGFTARYRGIFIRRQDE